ncbi:MAG: type II toxin-antitoxin system RelE/ParE family toxin [Planctomycetes bacterium]|nr:type II toxin-antitoxin system RelE/ParE family toxin [Planctomycetota bacterium]
MRVELRVEARRDLIEGALFYDQQRDGLGDYFSECLLADLERLEQEAGIHEVIFGLHRTLSRRFPFAIYYLTHGSVIDVVAILDCRRDPAAIAERLKGEQT